MSEIATPQSRALAHIAARSQGGPMPPDLRVCINFHPDRLVGSQPILTAMAADGCYRSQFETGTSNGSLTAHPGGRRWQWESRLFGAAYDSVMPAERPKYGSLNFRRRTWGPAPRFGAAYFRLNASVLPRTTFCYPDSADGPAEFGTVDRMALIALAESGAHAFPGGPAGGVLDPLDDYIEAQVHGPVLLHMDVEALVLDYCFRDTEVAELAAALPCPVEWHRGFRLSVETLLANADYRSPEAVALGLEIAEGDYLDARVLGKAARTGKHPVRTVKHLWHHIARFGAAD